MTEENTMVMRDWQFTEYFGFDAVAGEFILLDGFFWVIDDIFGDQVILSAAGIEEVAG